MSTDYNMLSVAAALPVGALALLFKKTFGYPEYSWMVILPILASANLASIVGFKLDGPIPLPAIVISWLAVGFVAMSVMTAIAPESMYFGPPDIQKYIQHNNAIAGYIAAAVLLALVSLALLAKMAADVAAKPSAPATAKSKHNQTIALSVGNGVVGLILLYFAGSWAMNGMPENKWD